MDFHDSMILWSYLSTNRNGDPIIQSPIQLPCRWEEGQTEIPDAMGNLLKVDVLMATIQNITLNSIVWEGTILGNPKYPVGLITFPNQAPPNNIYEVVIRIRAEDIKARNYRYEFGLRRYKDLLPQIGGT